MNKELICNNCGSSYDEDWEEYCPICETDN